MHIILVEVLVPRENHGPSEFNLSAPKFLRVPIDVEFRFFFVALLLLSEKCVSGIFCKSEIMGMLMVRRKP
jgi:hypothetical protein